VYRYRADGTRSTACRPARERSCPALLARRQPRAPGPPRRGRGAVRTPARAAQRPRLLAEEWDPTTRRQLGNFPQAFTHVALVNTRFNLDHAAPRRPPTSGRRSATTSGGRNGARREARTDLGLA
jgi:hypothetical protein